MTNRTEQEDDNGRETTDAADDRTPEDTASGRDGGILSLLCNMTRGIKADEDARGSEIGQTPVPSSRRTGPVVGGHEGFFGGSEAPGVCGSDGKPDDVQDEVQTDDHGRKVEHISEVLG